VNIAIYWNIRFCGEYFDAGYYYGEQKMIRTSVNCSSAKSPGIIAVFDFDGTITTRDSLIHFIISNFGFVRFALVISIMSPLVLLYKLGILTNHVPKERLFSHFFRGLDEDEFDSLCRSYSLNEIDMIVKDDAMERIRWHKGQGHALVLVTASIHNWIAPWAEKAGFESVIATGAETRNGVITGRFQPTNCYGKEKTKRFLEKYPDRIGYYLFAYGDSRGDREMLEIADEACFKKFRA
jgi:HAD superfamily hydrolase (TIGR01490 family)